MTGTNPWSLSVEQKADIFYNNAARFLRFSEETIAPWPRCGALHMADHRFYQIDAKGEERPAGSARMIAVWQNTDGEWKISRLISYDHVPPPFQ